MGVRNVRSTVVGAGWASRCVPMLMYETTRVRVLVAISASIAVQAKAICLFSLHHSPVCRINVTDITVCDRADVDRYGVAKNALSQRINQSSLLTTTRRLKPDDLSFGPTNHLLFSASSLVHFVTLQARRARLSVPTRKAVGRQALFTARTVPRIVARECER